MIFKCFGMTVSGVFDVLTIKIGSCKGGLKYLRLLSHWGLTIFLFIIWLNDIED